MAHYNLKNEPVQKKTVTHEAGLGYTQAPEKELVGILSTGIQNTFYEKEGEREKRLNTLISTIAKKNPTFAAKALIYARTVFGQRTVTHIGAVNLIPFLSGDPLGKRFFTKRERKENRGGIIYRLDDMTEILACYLAKNGAKASLPNSVKKGFKDAIEHSDKYVLAKYQMKGKSVSLVDIVNLVHPKETSVQGYVDVPVDEYKKAVEGTKFAKEGVESSDGNFRISTLRALVLGLLKQFNTAEDKNTKAGQEVAKLVKSGELSKVEAEKVLTEKKADNFSELINTKKIGYFALIRNLRNIIATGDSKLLEDALALIVNQDMIKKSLIWPHQIDLALEIMLIENSGRVLQKVTAALDKAYELSIPNLENLLPEGRTAVVFDTSGSMQGGWGLGVQIPVKGRGVQINKKPAEKAALIAATFAKGVCGDVYHFASDTAQITGWNPNDSINTLKREFQSHNGKVGHGTNMDRIFKYFADKNKRYDRVLIITDEQSHTNLEHAAKSYSDKYGTPYIYFINVCGYSATSMKEGGKVLRLQGYSADIYTKISEIEIDPNVIIKAINEINI